MRRWLFRLMYWLGKTPWDSGETPPEVVAAFEAGEVPAGRCLDLGCGTGTNAVYMAQQGRDVIGVDFVPRAIAKARARAKRASVSERARFYVADVTRLRDLSLPPCAYALDIGCFHGLAPEGQRRYAEDLARILAPGGRFMLYMVDPRGKGSGAFGLRPEQAQAVLAAWFDVRRMARSGSNADGSTWMWLDRKAA